MSNSSGVLFLFFLIALTFSGTNLPIYSNLKKFEFILSCFLFSILISFIFSLLINFHNVSILGVDYEYNIYEKRFKSWYFNSSYFGLICATSSLIINYFLIRSKNILYYLLNIVSFIFCFLSGSRFALILFITINMLFLLKSLLLTRNLSLVKILYASFFASIIVYLFLNYENFFLLRRFSNIDALSSLGGRTFHYKNVINHMSNAPISNLLFGFSFSSYNDISFFKSGAHSGLLRIFVEQGLIGLICIISIYLFLLCRFIFCFFSCNLHTFFIYTFIFLIFISELMMPINFGIGLISILFLFLVPKLFNQELLFQK